ncbi:bactofilin family protein [Selenihalanaerobacter shriftii]|uniref:Protein CcmA, bactofilin family n=1 Tax=Selenihalanaerobacter shriftii TaxID=142842 RepID=A0A1T4NMR0_9FIRM|nr:polymer-forming cytoskeletal protein [Selenihalanaerobacter shriftii]SJZ80504.1 protein CcmA, bactofilin family [Selenihalanaerobacter shriftii]
MLFGSKKKKKKKRQQRQQREKLNSNDMETIIGKGTKIEGTIETETSLRVDGALNGKLKSQGDVVVGEDGVLEADIEAKNITVAGSITGNVIASGKLVIVSTGKLIGDIKIANLIVEDGAVFKGQSESRTATTKRFNKNETEENDSKAVNDTKAKAKDDFKRKKKMRKKS